MHNFMREYETSTQNVTKTYKEVMCNAVKHQASSAHKKNRSYTRSHEARRFFARRRILAHVDTQRKANKKSASHATRKTFLDSYVFNSHLDEAQAFGATSDFLSIDFYFFSVRISQKA
jgi:hypothetical protein